MTLLLDKYNAIIVKGSKQTHKDNLQWVHKMIFYHIIHKKDVTIVCHKNTYNPKHLMDNCINILNQLDDNFKFKEDIWKGDLRYVTYEYKKKKKVVRG